MIYFAHSGIMYFVLGQPAAQSNTGPYNAF